MADRDRAPTGLADDEYEALLRSALDAYVAVLVVDMDDTILYANKSWSDMWGFADGPPEVVDAKFLRIARNVIHDVDAFEARIAYLRANPHETSFELVQFVDGRIFERFTAPLYVADKLHAQMWAFRDLSDRFSTTSRRLSTDGGEAARRLAQTSARIRDFVSRHVDDMCDICVGLISLLHDAIHFRDDRADVPVLSRYRSLHSATGHGHDPEAIEIVDHREGRPGLIFHSADLVLSAELFVAHLAGRLLGESGPIKITLHETALELSGPSVAQFPEADYLDIARGCAELMGEQAGYTKALRPGRVTFTRFPFDEEMTTFGEGP